MSKLLTLRNTIEIPVRFHEVDAMNIVWHGHYIKYFELGREALAIEHGFSYLSVYDLGFMTPVVKSICEHKSSLKYGDIAVVETTWTEFQSAKLVFSYKIYRKSDRILCASGETIQVFTNKSGELQLVVPTFFENWKSEMKAKLHP